MRWDDVRVLLVVSRTGLIAGAATELRMDPTTISRRLERLERDTGQTLLERHRTGPRLTAAGRRIAARAEAMEAALAALALTEQERSLLRVSTSEGFGTWFVAHHLPGFTRANPHVEVELVATSGFLSPSKRETDIAILLAKPRRGPLLTRKLGDYGLRLYANTRLIADAAGIESVADLRRVPLVGYVPDLIYAPELDYLKELGAGLKAGIRSTSINAQYRLIAAGAGIGVLPCFIGDADPVLTLVLPDVLIRRSFWLSVHRDVRHRPAVNRFVDWLIAETAANAAKFRPSATPPAPTRP